MYASNFYVFEDLHVAPLAAQECYSSADGNAAALLD